jgi:hypothetical protein
MDKQAREERLEKLWETLLDRIIEEVEIEGCPAGTLAVARQFLLDNNINGIINSDQLDEDSAILKLAQEIDTELNEKYG